MLVFDMLGYLHRYIQSKSGEVLGGVEPLCKNALGSCASRFRLHLDYVKWKSGIDSLSIDDAFEILVFHKPAGEL